MRAFPHSNAKSLPSRADLGISVGSVKMGMAELFSDWSFQEDGKEGEGLIDLPPRPSTVVL